MRYGSKKADGTYSINSAVIFCDALNNRNPMLINSFLDFLKECERLVFTEFKPTRNALNNVRGNWYEWLIAVGYIHFKNAYIDPNRHLVQLPNIKSLDYMSLYHEDIYRFIKDLRLKTKNYANLISSNPDFVIINNVPNLKIPNVTNVTQSTIQEIESIHNQLTGKLSFDDLIGFLSVKTSLRPDRRIQLSHEGALAKAFYEHLKGRLWKINAPGLKYYAAAMEVKNSDRSGLRTVATHSILSVNSVPEPAVNDVFEIKSGAELSDLFTKVLI